MHAIAAAHGAADEVPDEEIPERRENQRRPECVDEEDLIGCWRAAERTMLSGRQQVHQPVVVEVVVQVIRIPRRHVAFAELSDDGHLPDEVGGEIGPIGAPLRQIFADVRVGQADDERDGQQDERAGAGIAAREAREGAASRPAAAPARAASPPTTGASIEQRDVAGARQPTGRAARGCSTHSPRPARQEARRRSIPAAIRRAAWRRRCPAARTRRAPQRERRPTAAERARRARPGTRPQARRWR